MITLITGVPGSGKTAHVVEMILKELKQGRKIYSVGIPDLVACHQIPDEKAPGKIRTFAVDAAGNPRTWQKGTWLAIDTYTKPIETEDEFDDVDIDDATSAWAANGNGCFDKGALIIIDECQTYFRPRSSSSKVPDFIAAFEVHRHQGLDFWLLTQRPQLIDGNLRGLISRHIHIHTSSMGKKRLEWAEVQDPNSKQARSLANKSAYKPNPKVFELYRSAQLHTKLKLKLPNGVYMLGMMFFLLVGAVSFLYMHFKARISPDPVLASVVPSATASPVPFSSQSVPALPVEARGATRPRPPQDKQEVLVDPVLDSDVVFSGCFATPKTCACQLSDGSDAGLSVEKCVEHLGIDSLPVPSGDFGASVLASRQIPKYFLDARSEFARLHPFRDFEETKVFIMGTKMGYY